MSRRQKRQRFVQWLRSCFARNAANSPVAADVNRAIKLEQLENRALMAGDTISPLLGSAYGDPLVGSSTAGLKAEGEAAPDLVALAKAIKDAGAIMYGAYWCPHCLAQKELFQDGGKFLPYVEVTDANRQPNSIATSENITSYPTWVFGNQRLVGQQSLQALATLVGV
ncbi:MAG: peptidylprolyl isomerase, partial [Pirellulaceae bacterium]|nr:peptidylprolyl isomerase [Pirellulaceae bacterium]